MAIGFKLPVVCHKLYRVTAGKMNNFTRPNASYRNKKELPNYVCVKLRALPTLN